jgi:hypothetical protein
MFSPFGPYWLSTASILHGSLHVLSQGGRPQAPEEGETNPSHSVAISQSCPFPPFPGLLGTMEEVSKTDSPSDVSVVHEDGTLGLPEHKAISVLLVLLVCTVASWAGYGGSGGGDHTGHAYTLPTATWSAWPWPTSSC